MEQVQLALAPLLPLFESLKANEHVADFLAHFPPPDPRVADWPLMSVQSAILAPTLYLLSIVVFKLILRKPIEVPAKIRAVHNFLLVLLSIYMTAEFTRLFIIHKYSVFCTPLDRTENGLPMARIIWLFMASKIYEFLDTLIMVLRHKYDQVTFLHVYHHASIFLIWWMNMLVHPGGDGWLSCMLNSLVHVFMYMYYFLTALNPNYRPWWKIFITRGQILQFAIFIVQGVYMLTTNCLPEYRSLWVVNTIYAVTLMALFANFYGSYSKKPAGTALPAARKAATKKAQ